MKILKIRKTEKEYKEMIERKIKLSQLLYSIKNEI